MSTTVDPDRLKAAAKTVRSDLFAELDKSGHWTGQLASSPLATATAISALVLAEQHGQSLGDEMGRTGPFYEVYQSDLSELIINSLLWLAKHQNEDGGWGDTDRCRSNIATTMLVQAAFHLTGVPVKYQDLLERSEQYVASQGGIAGLRKRYGRDKTFAVPILTNCALADLVPWRKVSPLPFELACLPKSWFRYLKLPVVSYAIPALVAIGQARFFHRPPWNPIMRWVRGKSVRRSLESLQAMQPESGGYLEAVPLTSFVVMSLASTGRAEHSVTRNGVEFLLAQARADGSWPIDSNLATWNTSQAVAALANSPDGLAACFETPNESYPGKGSPAETKAQSTDDRSGNSRSGLTTCLDWLLECQQTKPHPMTEAAPGGWSWSDLSGAVPDADDTSAALLALKAFRESLQVSENDSSKPTQNELTQDLPTKETDQPISNNPLRKIEPAARAGIEWLLKIQNEDGGWPTFCRGWGKLPFDRSSCELTAHALRALNAWREIWNSEKWPDGGPKSTEPSKPNTDDNEESLSSRISRSIALGLTYLSSNQNPDGSWTPLWFGNQASEGEENRVFGTSRVLLAFSELDKLLEPPAQLALQWLVSAQDASGGWGPTPGPVACAAHRSGKPTSGKTPSARGNNGPANRVDSPDETSHTNRTHTVQSTKSTSADKNLKRSANQIPNPSDAERSSVEETAVACQALLSAGSRESSATEYQESASRGLAWLTSAIEQGQHHQATPIGLYFAKLWYHERLYPIIFSVAALSAAEQMTGAPPSIDSTATDHQPASITK